VEYDQSMQVPTVFILVYLFLPRCSNKDIIPIAPEKWFGRKPFLFSPLEHVVDVLSMMACCSNGSRGLQFRLCSRLVLN
jgi:hypothetical protein